MENNKQKGNVQSFMEESMISSLVEGILPKVLPMINPALEKLSEFLGDDEKTIIIRKKKGKTPLVLIFDNSKIYKVDGNEVTGDEGALISLYDTKKFVEKLIGGDFEL